MKKRYLLLLFLALPLLFHLFVTERISTLEIQINTTMSSMKTAASYSGAFTIAEKSQEVIDSVSKSFLGEQVVRGAEMTVKEFRSFREVVELGAKAEQDPFYAALFMLNHPDTTMYNDTVRLTYPLQKIRNLDTLLAKTSSFNLTEFEPLIQKSGERYHEATSQIRGYSFCREPLINLFLNVKDTTSARIALADIPVGGNHERVAERMLSHEFYRDSTTVDSLVEMIYSMDDGGEQVRVLTPLFNRLLNNGDTARAVALMDTFYLSETVNSSKTNYFDKLYVRSMLLADQLERLISYLTDKKLMKEYHYQVIQYCLKKGQPDQAEQILRKVHLLNRSSFALSAMVRYYCERDEFLKAHFHYRMLKTRKYRYADYSQKGIALLEFASYYLRQGDTTRALSSAKEALHLSQMKEMEPWHQKELIKQKASLILARAGHFSEAIAFAKRVTMKDGIAVSPLIAILREFARKNPSEKVGTLIDSIFLHEDMPNRIQESLPEIYTDLAEYYGSVQQFEHARIMFTGAVESLYESRRTNQRVPRIIALGTLFHQYRFTLTPDEKKIMSAIIQEYHPLSEGVSFFQK